MTRQSHNATCIYRTYDRLVSNGLVSDKLRTDARTRVIVRGFQRQDPELFPCRCDDEN